MVLGALGCINNADFDNNKKKKRKKEVNVNIVLDMLFIKNSNNRKHSCHDLISNPRM